MSRRERIRQKILARVEKADSGCWVWTGPTSGKPKPGDRKARGHSYPRMSLDGGTIAVHIAMFVLENGPIPPRKQVDHICRNRCCVNPGHLRLATHRQNQKAKKEAPTLKHVVKCHAQEDA